MSNTIMLKTDPYQSLIQKHSEFEMKLRGSTLLYTIPQHPLRYKVVEKSIPLKYLPFLGTVKKHVAKSGKEWNVDRQSIKYAMINPKLKKGFQEGEFVEVDINEAYWRFAEQLQIIDDSIYRKGQTVPKQVRLIALGSLATLTEVWQVLNHGEEEKKILSEREATYTNFFKICETLSKKVMQPIFKQFASDMFLFWVDAFIMRKDVEEQVKKEIKLFDLGLKTKPIDRIEITDRHIKCHVPYQEQTKDFPRLNTKQIFIKDHKRRIYYRSWLEQMKTRNI